MDTILLKFNYHLPNTDFFKERILTKDLNLEPGKGKRYVFTNNEWRKQRQENGLYTPNYGIGEDFVIPSLTYFYIECSLPKLLFGHSAAELQDTHLNPLIASLQAFFREIGIDINTRQILNAIPTKVAIAKNIDLTRFCSVHLALKALSPFDCKRNIKRRIVDFSDCKYGGKEHIFSTREETFKFYDKIPEIANNAVTPKEKAFALELEKSRYQSSNVYVNEILRAELTLKTKRKVAARFKKYLPANQELTFQNLFKTELWNKLLTEEVRTIYLHPLRHFIFLSLENKPIIQAFLDKNHKHIETKDTIVGLISSLQEYGLAQTRQNLLKKYDSRQTWYNYLNRIEKIDAIYDFSTLTNSDNYKIYRYILSQFGLDTTAQTSFDFNTVSKKLDDKQCNTDCGKLITSKTVKPSSVLLSDNLYGY